MSDALQTPTIPVRFICLCLHRITSYLWRINRHPPNIMDVLDPCRMEVARGPLNQQASPRNPWMVSGMLSLRTASRRGNPKDGSRMRTCNIGNLLSSDMVAVTKGEESSATMSCRFGWSWSLRSATMLRGWKSCLQEIWGMAILQPTTKTKKGSR